MKYMMVFSIAPENHNAVLKRFAGPSRDPKPGSGAKVLGRWHEMGTGKGFMLFEADDPVAVTRHLLQWSDLVDQRIVPVVEDEAIAKAMSSL